eukprot:31197-Pelagococcus_subviridis.AAC.5
MDGVALLTERLMRTPKLLTRALLLHSVAVAVSRLLVLVLRAFLSSVPPPAQRRVRALDDDQNPGDDEQRERPERPRSRVPQRRRETRAEELPEKLPGEVQRHEDAVHHVHVHRTLALHRGLEQRQQRHERERGSEAVHARRSEHVEIPTRDVAHLGRFAKQRARTEQEVRDRHAPHPDDGERDVADETVVRYHPHDRGYDRVQTR